MLLIRSKIESFSTRHYQAKWQLANELKSTQTKQYKFMAVAITQFWEAIYGSGKKIILQMLQSEPKLKLLE